MVRARRAKAATGAVAISLLVGLLAPVGASAHAAFLSAQPEPGTRLQAGPAEISLSFTEPLNGDLSDGSLVNASNGEEVPVTVLTRGRVLVLRPQVRLRGAPYTVEWRTVSTLDGHPLAGSFSFGVRTAALGGEHSLEQSPLARGGWLRIVERAVFYATLLFFAGGVLSAALLASPRRPAGWLVPDPVGGALRAAGLDPDEMAGRLWERTLFVGLSALSWAVVVAVTEAADAGGGLSLHSLNGYLLTNEAGLARVAAIAAIALALVLAFRSARLASLALVLAFGAIALSGHANSAEPRSIAVIGDWLHLVAGAVWLGGIAQIAAAWLPRIRGATRELRLAVTRAVLPRFGRVALPAFALVVVSGLTSALIELGHVPELWESAYGRVLAVKIGLVALIAAASYLHALRLRPRLLAANPQPDKRLERRHWRLLGAEPWIGAAVVAAAAALVAFPLPPRQLGEADEAEAAAPCRPSCPLPGASPDQLPVAEQAGSRIAAFWIERSAGALSGTLRLLNYNSKPAEASVEMPGAELSSCGTGCWRFGGVRPRTQLRALIDGDPLTVPAQWSRQRTAEATRLLRRAQAAMRGLGTVRIDESLTSGLGRTLRTHYRFAAPDRMAYRDNLGGQMVRIGGRTYRSTAGEPFRESGPEVGGFRYRQLFVWTLYGRTVRWLGSDRGRVRLALFDPGTPLWYRLTVDRRSGRVLRERMITGGHYMSRRYYAFDRPLTIRAPR